MWLSLGVTYFVFMHLLKMISVIIIVSNYYFVLLINITYSFKHVGIRSQQKSNPKNLALALKLAI